MLLGSMTLIPAFPWPVPQAPESHGVLWVLKRGRVCQPSLPGKQKTIPHLFSSPPKFRPLRIVSPLVVRTAYSERL